jgi:hypothetical protein
MGVSAKAGPHKNSVSHWSDLHMASRTNSLHLERLPDTPGEEVLEEGVGVHVAHRDPRDPRLCAAQEVTVGAES